MANTNYTPIPSLDTSWEGYAGGSVEEFIKNELANRAGYIYRTPQKEGDHYYLYGFRDVEAFETWAESPEEYEELVLFRTQLPNVENDVYTVTLSTTSSTEKLVNLGDGVKVNLRYTSTGTNLSTHQEYDTYNDGILIVSRSLDGVRYTEVGRTAIQPTPYLESTYREVDITRFLTDGDQYIRLKVEDSINHTQSNVITFQSIINTTLKLTNATDTSRPLSVLNFSFYVQGQVAKTLHILLDNNDYTFALGSTIYTETPYNCTITDAHSSGIKEIQAWLSVDNTELVSNPITFQIYYGQSDEAIVILQNKATTLTNYTNAKFFDFTLFNKVSDVVISVTQGSTHLLDYTYVKCPVNEQQTFRNIMEIESQQKFIDAIVTVTTDDMTVAYDITIDNSINFNPTAGADFVLNPKTRTNSELNRNKVQNAVSGSYITSTFTGFNWNTDGWLSDDAGIKVLKIPAGRNLQFNYDALNNTANGTTIEFEFKTYNVFDSDEVLFKFGANDANDNFIGWEMKAYEGCFKTVEKLVKRDQDVMWQDDVRQHIAINIIPNLYGAGINYVRIFLNGTINREFEYSNTDLFKLNSTDLKMIIGGNDCDIDIYGMRVYKKALSATDIRQDVISAIPDIEDKITYNTNNDILANNLISFAKASQKYNTIVWTGNVPSYSTGDISFNGDLEINIIGDPSHSGTINNMSVKGQGSSSKNYWKWNQQYGFSDDSVWIDGNGVERGKYYILDDDQPKAKKLVGKINWASSMQSHKIGSVNLYTDLWKDIVGGNGITSTTGFEKCRVSCSQKPFMFFVRPYAEAQPVFYCMMTFGSGKFDKPTFGYDEDRFPDYLALEGSDNGMPLTLRQVPWFTDEVTYDPDEEYYVYNGQGSWDYDLGNRTKINYFIDASNFVYLHSLNLLPDTGTRDTAYQYWDTTTGNVLRYDYISDSWVNAGITKTNGNYDALNIVTQTGISMTGDAAADNAAFIEWRKNDFRTHIGDYYNINDVLYSMAFLKMIAASDNRCKNTYEYLDPVTHKICMVQDDMDTIFATDNVGRKTKPYYVEEHDMNGTDPYWNGADNIFFNLMETVFDVELRGMAKSIFTMMRSNKYGGNTDVCMNDYYFYVQNYFPSVCYNETARLLYEEASVAQKDGRYINGTPAISQSLGDQLQGELQFWKRRSIYLKSWAAANPFETRSTGSMFFRSKNTTGGQSPSYRFTLNPFQWLYPKVGVGQTLGADNERVQAGNDYTTVRINTSADTDTFIYGINYYNEIGEFGGQSIGEAFDLSGERLLHFSADSREVDSYEFRPTSMTISCPVMKTICLYGCSTLSGTLDFTNTPSIQNVDLRGTGLMTVIIPNGSDLTTLRLPSLHNLTVRGCNNLVTFYVEGYSDYTSLNTDNEYILNDILQNTDTLALVNLTGIDAEVDNATAAERLYKLLIANGSTATGHLVLNKTLTNAEKTALNDKYGNIDNYNNSLYIEYTIVDGNSISISGPSSIPNTKSREYNVEYSGNNDKRYEWTVTGATYTGTGNHIIVTAPSTGTNDITISCTMVKLDDTALYANKTVSVVENIPIERIDYTTYEIPATGQHDIRWEYYPSNYTIDIDELVVTSQSEYLTKVSNTDNSVRMNCTSIPSNNIINTYFNIDMTDVEGNNINEDCHVILSNPISQLNANDNVCFTQDGNYSNFSYAHPLFVHDVLSATDTKIINLSALPIGTTERWFITDDIITSSSSPITATKISNTQIVIVPNTTTTGAQSTIRFTVGFNKYVEQANPDYKVVIPIDYTVGEYVEPAAFNLILTTDGTLSSADMNDFAQALVDYQDVVSMPSGYTFTYSISGHNIIITCSDTWKILYQFAGSQILNYGATQTMLDSVTCLRLPVNIEQVSRYSIYEWNNIESLYIQNNKPGKQVTTQGHQPINRMPSLKTIYLKHLNELGQQTTSNWNMDVETIVFEDQPLTDGNGNWAFRFYTGRDSSSIEKFGGDASKYTIVVDDIYYYDWANNISSAGFIQNTPYTLRNASNTHSTVIN